MSFMKERRLLAACIPVMLALTLVGCGDKPGSDLVGYWLYEEPGNPMRIMLKVQRNDDILTLTVAVPDFVITGRVQEGTTPLLFNSQLKQFGFHEGGVFTPLVRVGDGLVADGITYKRSTQESYAAFLQSPAILR